MGHADRDHRGSPPQGADVCNAGHLRQGCAHGQARNQTHLRVPSVQNQSEGPHLRVHLQAEEPWGDSAVGAGWCGSAAGGLGRLGLGRTTLREALP